MRASSDPTEMRFLGGLLSVRVEPCGAAFDLKIPVFFLGRLTNWGTC